MPKPGDFGLVYGTDRVGLLIRFAQWLNGDGFSRYSHAFVYLGDDLIMEAEPGGARYNHASAYDWTQVAYSDWNLSDRQREAVCQAARKCEGVPYSFLDYVGLALHRLHIPAPGLRKYIASTGHMICSELVDYCYLQAGLHMFSDGRWPGYVTPADLEHVLHGPEVAN